ncbi:MAG TPA: alpha-L-arabinofuranosidase C-terminal domain-containing protein [Chthonomonadaceae bacterium]|nr:alpha-L-arabinofuranosidase C-terminal domain-containing protein [Chthonomonadaceae bacterium]
MSVSARRFGLLAAFLLIAPLVRGERASAPSAAATPIRVARSARSNSTTMSTSSLFTYARDDTAAVTTVDIDAGQAASVPISRDIFGNFIEHLGGVVYPGLWANALLNPSLESIDGPGTRPAAPPHWALHGEAIWRNGPGAGLGFHSPACAQLLPPRGDERSSVSQVVHLPVHRTRSYRGSIAARLLPEADASAEKDPPRARIRIVVERADGASAPLAETTLDLSSAEWTVLPYRITVTGDIARGAAERFRVELADGAPVDVDRMELFPTDSVDGVDPDVLRRAREWHIPLLRWPGGNFASGYHWRDGVGPRAERPTRRNAAWGGLESNEFGCDEFRDLCRRLNAEPQLTVNAGDGTPAEAAAWVRYCNAPSQADDRDRAGVAGPASRRAVKLWEVGNELYGNWQIGHTTPDGNAQRYVEFRDAMLAADPSLRLIATGKGDEFLPAGLERDRAWNEALLHAAAEHGGRLPDYLSIHPLVPLPGSLGGTPYEAQFESAMAHPATLDGVVIPAIWDTIRSVGGPGASTRIAVTEWGIIVGGPTWRDGPNHDSQAGAVYNALCLNAMLRQSDRVRLANMTAFMHGGGIKKPGGFVTVDPQYYTQQLYAGADLRSPVAAASRGPGADVPQRGIFPAVHDVPDVDVFAALDGRRRLRVCLVNRRLAGSRSVAIRAKGIDARHCEATILDAQDARSRNTLEAPNAVVPRGLAVTAAGEGAQRCWTLTLPPHSFAIVTLSAR